jgi:hypothetical protein
VTFLTVVYSSVLNINEQVYTLFSPFFGVENLIIVEKCSFALFFISILYSLLATTSLSFLYHLNDRPTVNVNDVSQ